MRKALAALILSLMAVPALAVDASTAQQDCQDIRDAATAAQTQAIKNYTSGTDPAKVFQDSTEACLQNIIDYSKFEFRLPSLGDLQNMLKQMAGDLIMKACQSATTQFNKAVSDATSQLGGLSTNISGLGDVGLVNTGTGSVSVTSSGLTTSGAPVTTSQNSGGIVSSVINWFKGDSGTSGGNGDKQ